MIYNTISVCVIATNQTYVDALKKAGKFDEEAQKEAFAKTYNAVLLVLSDEVKKPNAKYKREVYGTEFTFSLGGCHNKVTKYEDEGLIVEAENGNYVNANLLSVGTIDQLYLALRLAIANEVTKEELPLILDEAFAYYDEERLENILSYLSDNFKENQIIIFTCSKREKEILQKKGIDYNYIEL